MMYSQVIQNQGNFSLSILDRTFEKLQKNLHRHGCMITHETSRTLVGDDRKHVNRKPIFLDFYDGYLAFSSKTTRMLALVSHIRLYLETEEFCEFFDKRVIFIKPVLNRLNT